MGYLLLFVASFLLALGQVLLSRLSSFPNTFSFPNLIAYLIQLILPLSVYAFALLTWLYILSRESLYYAYPLLMSSTLVLVSLYSILILRKPVNLLDLLGILFVIIGSSLLISGSNK